MTRRSMAILTAVVLIAFGAVAIVMLLATQNLSTQAPPATPVPVAPPSPDPVPTAPSPDVSEQPISQLMGEVATLATKVREATMRELQKSNLIIELDTPMVVGREYQVTLGIQAKDAAGATKQLDTVSAELPARTFIAEPVSTTPLVRATLSSADFDLEEQKGGWQLIVPEKATLWTWSLKPLDTGEKTLIFSLSSKVQVEGEVYEVPVENYPRRVVVNVAPVDMVAEIWKWSSDNAGAVILGICAVLGGIVSLTQLRDWYANKKQPVAFSYPDAEANTPLATPEPPPVEPARRARQSSKVKARG